MPNTMKEKIFDFSTKTLGFDDCRFTDVNSSLYIRYYQKWLEDGMHADMKYLKRHLPFKKNPSLLLKDVKSAIVLAKNYKNTKEKHLKNRLKISRYAAGKDYHAVILNKLKEIEGFLKKQNSEIECYGSVDSRPVAERSLAIESGVGFLGKNTMVIKSGLGSYFFIGIILTTHRFESDRPLNQDCKRCRLCIDACPTGAIKDNYRIDAKKCISYLTIERKKALSEKEASEICGWVFGCDICQEVCPYNSSQTPITNWIEFLPKSGVGFDFFEDCLTGNGNFKIPKNSCLNRSKKRILANLQTIKNILPSD